jgi:hypothetical protein
VKRWFRARVALLVLAKCVVRKSRETKTVPRIASIPVSGKRRSRTTAGFRGLGINTEPVIVAGPGRR